MIRAENWLQNWSLSRTNNLDLANVKLLDSYTERTSKAHLVRFTFFVIQCNIKNGQIT